MQGPPNLNCLLPPPSPPSNDATILVEFSVHLVEKQRSHQGVFIKDVLQKWRFSDPHTPVSWFYNRISKVMTIGELDSKSPPPSRFKLNILNGWPYMD